MREDPGHASAQAAERTAHEARAGGGTGRRFGSAADRNGRRDGLEPGNRARRYRTRHLHGRERRKPFQLFRPHRFEGARPRVLAERDQHRPDGILHRHIAMARVDRVQRNRIAGVAQVAVRDVRVPAHRPRPAARSEARSPGSASAAARRALSQSRKAATFSAPSSAVFSTRLGRLRRTPSSIRHQAKSCAHSGDCSERSSPRRGSRSPCGTPPSTAGTCCWWANRIP